MMKPRRFLLILAVLLAFILLTALIDFLEARFQNTSFYFSESFLFSSFWWLFVPFIYAQFVYIAQRRSKLSISFLVIGAIATHLFSFPALVWLISSLSYEHTFWYWQTFQFGLTEHFFTLSILYTVPIMIAISFKNKLLFWQKVASQTAESKEAAFKTSFVVAEGNNRFQIKTRDILFFSADPPYVNIHHKTKKYLHNGTLKSLEGKIDPNFIRIHKSTIVNLSAIKSYRSRLNGDYDLTLIDGAELRLSRNYIKNFRSKFESGHQDTLT